MARRRMYAPQPEYVPPGMVDFGQIDFGHDIVAQQMPGILQNYQQRWDMQDAAIAKLLEEQAGTQMLEGDAQAVGNLLKSSFDEIDTLVKDKYQGDRGAAAMDIVKRLSAARAPLAQARAEKEKYDKAFEQYQQLAIQGRAPQAFDVVDEMGNIAPKTLGFEEFYSDTARSAFDEKGKYVPRTYGTLRGASDLSGYLAQNVSKALNADSEQSGLLDSQTAGYLFQLTKSGTSPQQIEEQIFKNKATGELTTYGKELAQQLRGEVDFLQDELGTNASDEQLMRYATPIIQGQVAQQMDRRYIQDGRTKPGEGSEPPIPIDYLLQTVDDLTLTNAKPILQNKFKFAEDGSLVTTAKDYPQASLPQDAFEAEEAATFGTSPNRQGDWATAVQYKRDLQEFRKDYGLEEGYTDAQINEMYLTLQNYPTTTLGTLISLPQTKSYDKRNLVSRFINEKDGTINVSQDIYLNNKRIDKKDKIAEIANLLGMNKKDVQEQLKSFGANAMMDFSGNTPSALVGFIRDKKDRTVRIEIPTSHNLQTLGKDIKTISDRIVEGNNKPFSLTNKIALPNGETASKAIVTVTFEGKTPIPKFILLDENNQPLTSPEDVTYLTTILLRDAKSELLKSIYNY